MVMAELQMACEARHMTAIQVIQDPHVGKLLRLGPLWSRAPQRCLLRNRNRPSKRAVSWCILWQGTVCEHVPGATLTLCWPCCVDKTNVVVAASGVAERTATRLDHPSTGTEHKPRRDGHR